MTELDDLEAVVRLACLTEDRSNSEHRSLLRIAKKVDRERNANVITNKAMWGRHAGSTRSVRQRPESNLAGLVEETLSRDGGLFEMAAET